MFRYGCGNSLQAQAAISGAASIDETIESRVKMQVDLVRHRVLDEKEMSKALRTMSVFRSSQGDLEVTAGVLL